MKWQKDSESKQVKIYVLFIFTSQLHFDQLNFVPGRDFQHVSESKSRFIVFYNVSIFFRVHDTMVWKSLNGFYIIM